MLSVVFEFLALELGVVHLAECIDDFLEEIAALLVVLETEISVADVKYKLKHVALTLKRTECVDRVECILLEDNEVNKLRLPVEFMIAHWHTVITEE